MDAFGTADTELLGKAGISSANFIATVSDELGKLEKATGGVRNEAENLDDAWFRLKANIGGSGEVFSGAMSALADVVEWAAKKTEIYNKAVIDGQRKTAIAVIKEWNNGGKERNAIMQRDGDIASRYYARDVAQRVDSARKLLAAEKTENEKGAAATKAKVDGERLALEGAAAKAQRRSTGRSGQSSPMAAAAFRVTVVPGAALDGTSIGTGSSTLPS